MRATAVAGLTPLPGEWAVKGACRGKPTNWWYPGRSSTRFAPTVWAKEICAGCPVRRPCLDHALRYREAGMWGGTLDSERRGMRRRKAAA